MSKLKAIRPVVEKDEEFLSVNTHLSSDDEDEEKHSKLLDAINKLGSKNRQKISQRTEPISKINEHALAQVGSGEATSNAKKVLMEDLLQAIAEKPRLRALPTAIKQVKKRGKPLETPLEKPQALRVERAAGYEKVKDEVGKWDNLVRGNRVAEQLIFPLNQPAVKLVSAKEFASKFKPVTPLEQQISELLRGNKHVQEDNQELTPAEQEALSSMSLKEALERRKELARTRVLQSYQEAKARRQNKIKSKKYHRLLKKDKIKNHLKEFETLKEHDPEGALEKLEQLDRKRIEERMTLKHKGAGKWAKLQAIRSKYDENARESLAEQLRIGKEVTRKIKKSDDESDEEVSNFQPIKSDNPWLGGSSAPAPASQEITSGYRKLWNTVNDGKAVRKQMEESGQEEESSDSESVEEEIFESEEEEPEGDELKTKFSEELDEDLIQKKTLNDFEVKQTLTKKRKSSKSVKKATSSNLETPETNVEKEDGRNKKPNQANIDPNKFVTMVNTVVLKSSVPNTEEGGEEEDEEELAATQRRMTLAEAFAEDDVVDQFREEKKRAVDASAPKDIDLTLPGWGEWGGTGLKMSRRKKKLFIIKAPPAPKRRDDNQGNLILNEDKNPAMRRQQVNDLPFPFRSAAAFESTIRAPVTSTFIPESASRQLSAPKVITKIGTVIEPMTEDAIIKTSKRTNKENDDEEDEDKPKAKKGRKDIKKKKILNSKKLNGKPGFQASVKTLKKKKKVT